MLCSFVCFNWKVKEEVQTTSDPIDFKFYSMDEKSLSLPKANPDPFSFCEIMSCWIFNYYTVAIGCSGYDT